jgi:hypothetical protein
LHGNAGNTDFNTIFDYAKHFRNESKIILSIEQTSSILSFVNIGIYFISTWLYYNQIVVTFRLGTRLSSSNQISVLNTPLYCRKVTIVKQHYCKYYCIPFIYIYILFSWLSSKNRPEKKPFKLKVFLGIYRKLRKDPDHLIFMND